LSRDDIWFFIRPLVYSFGLANECSLVLARALGLPTASFWGFGYQGGEVTIIHEISFCQKAEFLILFGTCKHRFPYTFLAVLHICTYCKITLPREVNWQLQQIVRRAS
jgi:hypothetical protein